MAQLLTAHSGSLLVTASVEEVEVEVEVEVDVEV